MRRLDDLQSSHQNFLMYFLLRVSNNQCDANKVANFLISLCKREPCSEDHFSSSRRPKSQQTNQTRSEGVAKRHFLSASSQLGQKDEMPQKKLLWSQKGSKSAAQRKISQTNKSRRARCDSIFRFDSQREARCEAAKRYYFCPCESTQTRGCFSVAGANAAAASLSTRVIH